MKNTEGAKKIVFYCRKGIIAQGDFALYYKIANYLCENYPDIEVYCAFDITDNVKNLYNNSSVTFCSLTPDMLQQLKNATFITAFNQAFFLLDEIRTIKSAKVLFLFLHPHTVKWFYKQVEKQPFSVNSILKLLKRTSGYGFQDESTYISCLKDFKVKVAPVYFPVVNDAENPINAIEYLPICSMKCVNIGWIGRLDSDKIYSVINLLDNLYDSTDCRVVLHIIGDGKARNMIKINKYAPKISIAYNSYLYGEERDRYLVENVDIVVAMGTSSLVAAQLGIPVVLPLVSSTPFRDDKYVYLFDTQNYCIGWTKEDIASSSCKTHMIGDIVSDIYEKNLKQTIGKHCREYANRVFSISNCSNIILPIINGTMLEVRNLMHNFSIRLHFLFYKLYKVIFNSKAQFLDFTVFHERYVSFMKLPVKERIRKLYKKTKSFLYRKLNKIKRSN